jgi:nicotinamide-nucleotide amidase
MAIESEEVFAELVIIGDELLAGAVRDANVAFLAGSLLSAGIKVSRVTFTSDDPAELKPVLSESFNRSSLVISCGGLGPTCDDVTRKAAAEIFDRELKTDGHLLEFLKERCARSGRELSLLSATQADVPERAELLTNPVGAAPGIILTDDARTLILLPGVPREMQAITESGLIPYLERNHASEPPHILLLRTAGTVEVEVVQRIGPVLAKFPGLKVSYLPERGVLDLRIEARSSRVKSSALLEFRQCLGDDLYAEGRKELSEVIGEMLLDRSETLAVAESCTGGMLAARIVDAPGSSAYFPGGVVSYSNQAKQDLLNVPGGLFNSHGAVSEEVAKAMAEGARNKFNSTYALSITGIAGPGGGSVEKPAGLAYVGLALPDSVAVRRFVFPGDRSAIRERSVMAALDMLRRRLLK